MLPLVLIANTESPDLGSPCGALQMTYRVHVSLGDVSASPDDPEADLKTELCIQILAKGKRSTAGMSVWKWIVSLNKKLQCPRHKEMEVSSGAGS